MNGIRLIHADCLDFLPSLEADSIDALVTSDGKVDAVPFREHVAAVAKADEIRGEVSIVRVGEGRHGLDVVNVRPPLGSTAAAPTGLLVPGPRLAPRCPPVGAVILRVPAAPGRVVRPLAVGIAAGKGAEWQSALARPPIAGVVERVPAMGADGGMETPLTLRALGCFDHRCFAFGRVDVGAADDPAGSARGSAGVVAGAGTEDGPVLALHLRRCLPHGLAANGAEKGLALRLGGRAEAIGTDAGAGGLPPVFETPRVCKVGLEADGASLRGCFHA